jgi:cobalamin synthase
MAPLQKRALYSLLIGLILAAALVAVFVIKRDINAFNEYEGFRYIVYFLWIGVPLVYLILVNLTLRKPTQIDERDRLIMERAPKTQLLAIFLSLAAWLIILTEVYRDSGQIPIIFMTLIFISTLVISTLAQSLGILTGYWKNQ